MPEIKNKVSKKTYEEKLIKDLENSITGEEETVEETPEVEKVAEDTVPEPEVVETVEEHIFKDSKKKNNVFAEAAANAALKAAIDANNEISMKEAEKAYFIEKKNHMLRKCKKDKKVTRNVSKFFAPYLGKVYTFLYNGIPVTIYCDGQDHEYPEFIARKIDKKLQLVADSNTYKEVIDERLDQDTF